MRPSSSPSPCSVCVLVLVLVPVHVSRIDQARERVEQLRTQLKEEVTTEVVAEQRRARLRRVLKRVGGCCLVYLVGLVGIGASSAYILARTGFVPVPGFSRWVAHERQPTRMVTPADVDLDRKLGAAVREATVRGTLDQGVTLAFTEGEMTALLRSAFAEQQDAPWLGDAAQIAIVGSDLEFHARLPADDGDRTLLLRGAPHVDEHGELAFDISRAEIGTLPVPSLVVEAALRSLLQGLHLPFTVRSLAVVGGKVMVTVAMPEGSR